MSRSTARCSLLVSLPLALGVFAGAARAGGSPIGFVTLPAQASLAVLALPGGGMLGRIPVPGTPRSVAASVNGRRILVASPDAGTIAELDGVQRRLLRVFRGFAQPVAVALDYEPPVGLVTPRYAFVLERAPAAFVVLDLVRARIAAHVALGAEADLLAVDGTTVWIAGSGSPTLARVDVSEPSAPRLLPAVEAGAPVAALAADPDRQAVFVAFRASGVLARYLDGGARARLGYRRTIAARSLVGLAPALPDLVIAADRQGRLYLLRAESGRPVARLHVQAPVEALAVYGGWLVALRPGGLALLGVPDGSMSTSIPLGARVGGFAWAVL